MDILITGNLKSKSEIEDLKKDLKRKRFKVSVSRPLETRMRETAKRKRKKKPKKSPQLRAIKNYWKAIEDVDALLVVNKDKGKVKNFIDGKTLLEMGFAHVMGKKMYLLNHFPRTDFRREVEAMDPIILKGDISKI